MEDIKKIAIELFDIMDFKPSRSGGAHEISIFSKVDRSNFPDMLPDDFTDLAKYIDHTILKPDTTIEDLKKVCSEAEKYKFRSVCVNPGNVKIVKSNLQTVDLCSVIGFPLGANTTEIKCAETNQAIAEGAVEIDMVINLPGDARSHEDSLYIRRAALDNAIPYFTTLPGAQGAALAIAALNDREVNLRAIQDYHQDQ